MGSFHLRDLLEVLWVTAREFLIEFWYIPLLVLMVVVYVILTQAG